MSSYIDFIDSISDNGTLASEFKKALNHYSSEKLSSWFNDKGYAVSVDDCDTISKNKTKYFGIVEASSVPY